MCKPQPMLNPDQVRVLSADERVITRACRPPVEAVRIFRLSPHDVVLWYAIPRVLWREIGLIPISNPYRNDYATPAWVKTEDDHAILVLKTKFRANGTIGRRTFVAPMGKVVDSPVNGGLWIVVDDPRVGSKVASGDGRDIPLTHDWEKDPRTAKFLSIYLRTLDEVLAARTAFGVGTVSQARRMLASMLRVAAIRKKVQMELNEKMKQALESRGIKLTDPESYALDSVIEVLENSKMLSADDTKAGTLALQAVDRLTELLAIRSNREPGEVVPSYEIGAGDVEKLEAGAPQALPPVGGAHGVEPEKDGGT